MLPHLIAVFLFYIVQKYCNSALELVGKILFLEKKKSSQRFLERDFYLHFPFSFGRRTYDLVPFDRISLLLFFFPISEHKCPVDEREQLEETLPLILGLILGLVIVVTLAIYHIHQKMTANQVQIPRDRSQYKHMG